MAVGVGRRFEQTPHGKTHSNSLGPERILSCDRSFPATGRQVGLAHPGISRIPEAQEADKSRLARGFTEPALRNAVQTIVRFSTIVSLFREICQTPICRGLSGCCKSQQIQLLSLAVGPRAPAARRRRAAGTEDTCVARRTVRVLKIIVSLFVQISPGPRSGAICPSIVIALPAPQSRRIHRRRQTATGRHILTGPLA